MSQLKILVANRLIRLTGNIFKVLSYPFHWVLPKARFTIPAFSPARVRLSSEKAIPRTIWQTNFTDQASLPVYLNYLFNRLMSLNCDYRYVSTEARGEYLEKNAPTEVFNAYSRLTNGAAQADLWRLFVLYKEGGVYMDIDATLVRPLDKLLGEASELYIKVSNNTEVTNYFIASAPGNPDLQETLDQVVYNINHYKPEMGVYHSTGPTVLNQALAGKPVNAEDRKYVCIQGTFTNEHFQYIDKPRGKWTHIKPEDLVK
ncbi:glycosyltransferase family 32 protein [Vibrio sinaloensis]|uniref:glycosyltransferase family 32 protein n=1 Tax=Photobacterium sp. (strain ATCC 43367) TaxID=379097 RepID=UPI0020547A39|nr:glycosyltransferase family 32 protein [Vibrio sinaloensis]UPQ88096.1 glycosyltransferase family 32 protein [Vibrio sinaloensis]